MSCEELATAFAILSQLSVLAQNRLTCQPHTSKRTLKTKHIQLTNPFKSSNSQTKHIQSLPIKTISPIPAVSSHTSKRTLKTKNKMMPKPTKSNSVSLLRCQQSDRHERTLKTINNQIWQPCNQNTNAGSGHTRM